MKTNCVPFAVFKEFSIYEGPAVGRAHIANNPYLDDEQIADKTILVVDYPASTFFQLLFQAGAIIAYKGTKHIEAAKFLR